MRRALLLALAAVFNASFTVMSGERRAHSFRRAGVPSALEDGTPQDQGTDNEEKQRIERSLSDSVTKELSADERRHSDAPARLPRLAVGGSLPTAALDWFDVFSELMYDVDTELDGQHAKASAFEQVHGQPLVYQSNVMSGHNNDNNNNNNNWGDHGKNGDNNSNGPQSEAHGESNTASRNYVSNPNINNNNNVPKTGGSNNNNNNNQGNNRHNVGVLTTGSKHSKTLSGKATHNNNNVMDEHGNNNNNNYGSHNNNNHNNNGEHGNNNNNDNPSPDIHGYKGHKNNNINVMDDHGNNNNNNNYGTGNDNNNDNRNGGKNNNNNDNSNSRSDVRGDKTNNNNNRSGSRNNNNNNDNGVHGNNNNNNDNNLHRGNNNNNNGNYNPEELTKKYTEHVKPGQAGAKSLEIKVGSSNHVGLHSNNNNNNNDGSHGNNNNDNNNGKGTKGVENGGRTSAVRPGFFNNNNNDNNGGNTAAAQLEALKGSKLDSGSSKELLSQPKLDNAESQDATLRQLGDAVRYGMAVQQISADDSSRASSPSGATRSDTGGATGIIFAVATAAATYLMVTAATATA